MAFVNKPRDYSKKPPVTPIIPGVLSVLDTSDIDLTYNTPLGELSAILTTTGVSAGTYGSGSLVPVITVDSKGRITNISTTPVSGGGSAAWGSIGAGTGVGSQADLVAYLAANYYPLSNPSGYITSAALTPYLTIAAAASTYVPLTRTITINGATFDLSVDRSWTVSASATWGSITGTLSAQTDLISYLAATYYPLSNPSGYITSAALAGYVQNTRAVNTQHSLTGGGDLSADRTLNLVNDVASPGNSKIYSTNPSGTRGWNSIPQLTGLTIQMYQQDNYIAGTQSTSIEYIQTYDLLVVTNLASNSVIMYNASTGEQLGSAITITNALKCRYIESINEIWVTSTTAASIRRISPTSYTEILPAITSSVVANGIDILEY